MASPAAPDPKSKAACEYIDKSLDGLNKLKTAVCSGAEKAPLAAAAKPASGLATLNQPDIEAWLKTKGAIAGNEFLLDATVAKGTGDKADEFIIKAKDGKTFNIQENLGLDATADEIAATLSGVEGKTMVMAGGRRRKRSARRSFRSSKGCRGNRSRRSRKGGKKSRRGGRTNKRRNGGTIGPALKAWLERQKAATGKDPISKKTIAKTKTKSQATGSEQRLESGKSVAAKNRGF
jgi:hypothetical protein